MADAESLRAAAEGCEAIVHLVAILNGSDAEFEAINAGGPRNVVTAARANGIRRLVHMSALGVSKEHAPLTRYWASKYAGKLAVTESDLDWTVMEPSFVFGCSGPMGPGFAFSSVPSGSFEVKTDPSPATNANSPFGVFITPMRSPSASVGASTSGSSFFASSRRPFCPM